MRQNVKVVGRCSGFSYSDQGATHYSLEDIAILRTIPGVTIVNPGDPVEIHKAVQAICQHCGPVYLRIGKYPMPVLFNREHEFQLGRGVLMSEGRDIAMIASGTLLAKAVEAKKILEEEGLSVMLINMHTLKPFDRDLVVKAAKSTRGIITVEDHYLAGGLGSIVAEVLASEYPTPVKSIGIDDRFVTTGSYDEILHLYGFEPPQIAATAKEFFRRIAPD
jgi:transketolase